MASKNDTVTRLLERHGQTYAQDIFFREVQVIWPELMPFADRRARHTAQRLGLGGDARELRRLARSDADFARLVAALVRSSLEGDLEAIKR